MLTIRVEYLTGVCFAARHDDRSRAEWPPHPDRLYSALVAAAAEPGDGQNADAAAIPQPKREALEWLAKQGAPEVRASEAFERLTVEVFMPTNPHENEVPDSLEPNNPLKNPAKARAKHAAGVRNLLPVHRTKAGLPIPAVIPDDPVVEFVWPNVNAADGDPHVQALRGIAARVGYLGRSRSLVSLSVHVQGDPPVSSANCPMVLVPDRHGDRQLRVHGSARLEYLVDHYKYGGRGGKPAPSPPQRYRARADGPGTNRPLRTVFDRIWILRPRPEDPALPIEATVMLTRRFRAALLRCCDDADDNIKACISGHGEHPHPAFLALPFVHPTQRHADGSIKGVAIAFPRDVKDRVLAVIARGLARLGANGLNLPGIGAWHLEEVVADAPPIRTLDVRTWLGPSGGSRVWTTATPMVFGRFPKPKTGGEPGEVLESLRMVSAPRPHGETLADYAVEIAIDRHSPLHGAAPSLSFKAARDRGGKNPTQAPARYIRHVTLRFDRPVRGPMFLGAMRYFGMGLMCPLEVEP